MQKFKKIGLIVLGVLIILLVVKDFFIKPIVTTVGSSVAGAPLKIKSLSTGFIGNKVWVKGIKLYNPKGFPAEPMIDITEVGADLDLMALATGKLHLPLVIMNLHEMTIIKNKEGVMNVEALKVTQAAEEKKEEPKDTKEKSKPVKMKIDVMKLNIGQVIYKDYSKGEPPVVQVYDVALKDKTFKNITSPEQLATLVMMEAMGPTAIKSAKMYAAATILGVGFLPAGVAGLFIGKDDATADFKMSVDRVYDASLKLVQTLGELKSDDRSKGTIQAKVNGNDVTILIAKGDHGTKVIVSARKMMMPRAEAAGGILRQLTEALK